MTESPILARDGATWIPAPEAKGPFPGVHGGVICGALAAAMEGLALERAAGAPLSLAVHLMRAVPVAPFAITTRIVREGGRVVVLEAELVAEGKVSAVARATFARPLAIPGLAAPAPEPRDPGACPPFEFEVSYVEGRWLRHACEFRDAGKIVWARLIRPLALPETPLARIACLADWSTGITRPDGHADERVIASFPNLDLTIHLARPPVAGAGGWIGLEGAPYWQPSGVGFTETVLYDTFGVIGHASQSVLLFPRGRGNPKPD